ncbi:hypothetical protein QQS21_007058 [Conoideocrella luteorostrata]|uniref:2EXR domain-containing protein n=1 Tax=Conoideocrella luteorostrata TaxID=1105319 RepID=A0AAJ0CLD5_9HYPO|nr:hypothetical protein QQS21_007058 [Conoideocrella luteorostrata]
MTPSTFTLFPNLPPELRDLIWRHTLPPNIQQALYIYRRGCWQPRYLQEDEEDYSPDDPALNLNFEFHHALLKVVQFDIPAFSVNREAQSIASAWIKEHKLRIRCPMHSPSPIFVREFDPELDTLYVPHERWDEFVREPLDRQFDADLLHRNLSCPPPKFTRIAIDESILGNEPEPIVEFFEWYTSLEELFIVSDVPAGLPGDDNIMVQPRMELDGMHRISYTWSENREKLEWERQDGSTGALRGEVYSLIEENSGEKLIEKLTERGRGNCFRIRPASSIVCR